MKRIAIFLLALSWLLIACKPHTDTAVATPTPTPPPQVTAVPTITPSNTPPPTATAARPPTSTPTPFPTPMPAQPPTPTPTLYPDIWIAGFAATEQSGETTTWILTGSAIPLPQLYAVHLEAASEAAQTALEEAAAQHTLLKLTGDLYPLDEQSGRFTYREVTYVYPGCAPEIPLDAAFTHPQGLFQFNYPAGWHVITEPDGSILLDNGPPDIAAMLANLGTEYMDIRDCFLRITPIEGMSAAEYAAQYTGNSNEFGTVTVTAVTLGSIPATRIVTPGMMGSWIEYVIELDGLPLSIGTLEEKAPFAEHIITTLRRE